MADLIRTSETSVIYAAPGLDEIIAKAIFESAEKIGVDSVSVLIDTDEKPYRLGYGTIEGINLLRNHKIPIRHAPNLRIGCLVCDDSGWIFSPTPLLIEAGSDDDLEPNAISVSTAQIEQLIQSINPVLDVGDERIEPEHDDNNDSEKQQESLFKEQDDAKEDDFIKKSLTPEIGQQIVTEDKLEKVKNALDENPPQKFDIARRVQVFESYIEFVEISLLGCEIHRHTAPIPSKLLVGGADDQTVKQLKAAFQIIEKSSKISNDKLRKKVNQLRKDYTRSITKYGNVILKAKKKEFQKKVEHIQTDLEKYQEEVIKSLGEEIEKSKKRLIDALLPAIKDKPPQELLGQIPAEKPTDEQAKQFLTYEIEKFFPEPEKLIKEMTIDCIFKAVTYETISNEDFQKKIRKAFRYVDWSKPFEEYEASLYRFQDSAGYQLG